MIGFGRRDRTALHAARALLAVLLLTGALAGRASMRIDPPYGAPGLWVSLRAREVAARLNVEIGGAPAVVQADLPGVAQQPGVVFVRIPAGAHSGTVTAH